MQAKVIPSDFKNFVSWKNSAKFAKLFHCMEPKSYVFASQNIAENETTIGNTLKKINPKKGSPMAM